MTSRTRLFSRFAWVGVIVFGVGITALGVWSTFHTLQGIDRTKRLVTLSDGWKQTRFWIAEEETLERKYRIERLRHDGYYHSKIVALFIRTVLRLRPISTVQDNAKIDTLLAANAKYVAAMGMMFRAVDAGNERRVDEIHNKIDPTYDLVEHIAVAEETIYNRSAFLSLARLEQTQRFVATAFPTLAAFGLLAIVAFGFVISEYRRKTDELLATQVTRLERAAFDDALTGLGNSRAFEAKLASRAALGPSASCHLALIDVDHFKQANDRFGHLHGDNVLRELGAVLRELPPAACAYRIGGDEFAVLFSDVAPSGVLEDLRRMQQRSASRLYGNTLSIGVASAGDGETEVAALHEHADVALYEAKHRGRNKIIAFDAQLLETSTSLGARRVVLDRILASPAACDIVFQAIWAYDGGALLGYEALARFSGDFTSPLEAFAVAERLDRAHELDARCIASIGAHVPAEFPGLLHVNISPATLLHGDTAAVALAELSSVTKIAPERIVVEVTEHTSVAPEALERVSDLRARGFRVALDDTGSGNAGLAILVTMPLDTIKIDKSLLATLGNDPKSRAIVSGIMLIAKGLGCNVVVEGVETREHIRLCGDLAGEHGLTDRLALQGFGLGRPCDARAIAGAAFHPALRRMDDPGERSPGDRRTTPSTAASV